MAETYVGRVEIDSGSLQLTVSGRNAHEAHVFLDALVQASATLKLTVFSAAIENDNSEDVTPGQP